MIDLTIPIIIVNVGLPAFQIYRVFKKGKIKHRNLRIILNILVPEAMMIHDGISWVASKYRQKQAKY